MTDWIIMIVYWVVFVGTIHPLYTAILRTAARHRDPMNLPGAAALATLGAFVWPLAVPFLLSHYLHTGRVFNRRDELNEVAEKVRNDKLADASRTHAMMEIERTATETIIDAETIPATAMEEALHGRPWRHESIEKLSERLVQATAQGDHQRANAIRAEMWIRLK